MIERSPLFLPAAGMAGALCLFGGLAFGADLELPVPNVTIYPGDVIRDDLLEERSFPVPAGESWAVYRARDGLVGKTARRTLLPGKPIALNAARDPYVVQQGKPVALIFQEGALTITAQAVPLQSGGIGDLLSLRNTESGAVVKGIVQADGTVRVAGP
jgi:flagella basal body P-ring formation protein FlgA